MHRLGRVVATVTFAALALPASPSVRGEDKARADRRVEMELRLYGAVFREAPTGKDDPALLVHLERSGERWSRAWGHASQYAHSCHPGRVAATTESGERLNLTLVMDIRGDSWAPPAGHGRYEVTLRRTKEGHYDGRFTGKLKGVSLQGRAEARVLPPYRKIKNAPAPAGQGEHPRILFRRQDLSSLRQKADTPFGKAAMAKMTDAIGLGVRYQLTGDRSHAAKAV